MSLAVTPGGRTTANKGAEGGVTSSQEEINEEGVCLPEILEAIAWGKPVDMKDVQKVTKYRMSLIRGYLDTMESLQEKCQNLGWRDRKELQ